MVAMGILSFRFRFARSGLTFMEPMPLRRSIPPALFVVALLLSMRAPADDALPVKVSDAWVRAVPPSLNASAAFMSVENTGDTPLRLTGGKASIAPMAMPMSTTHKFLNGADVLGMGELDYIEIPPHGVQVLKPGGYHLMLISLTAHPQPGDMVTLTLVFDPGHRKLTVTMPARLDAAP